MTDNIEKMKQAKRPTPPKPEEAPGLLEDDRERAGASPAELAEKQVWFQMRLAEDTRRRIKAGAARRVWSPAQFMTVLMDVYDKSDVGRF